VTGFVGRGLHGLGRFCSRRGIKGVMHRVNGVICPDRCKIFLGARYLSDLPGVFLYMTVRGDFEKMDYERPK
jgi:hypothetical protein